MVSAVADKLEQHNIDTCEDELELEQKAETERLRKLGLERARKEEEAQKKRDAEEHLRCEMEQKEIEQMMRKENSRKRRLARDVDARKARTPENLRYVCGKGVQRSHQNCVQLVGC
jgi:hypothetical protein